ncbi:hypothetical protein CYMTET_41704, partial [Cymbomonas tetramitiformis]
MVRTFEARLAIRIVKIAPERAEMRSITVCTLLISLALVDNFGLTDAAKRKSGLIVQTLEKAPVCKDKAAKGDKLTVHYVGTLKDGTVFDGPTSKVGRPIVVKLGGGQVIKGWEEGLEGMCVGEKRRLIVPSKLGYGEAGQGGKIPGGEPRRQLPHQPSTG